MEIQPPRILAYQIAHILSEESLKTVIGGAAEASQPSFTTHGPFPSETKDQLDEYRN